MSQAYYQEKLRAVLKLVPSVDTREFVYIDSSETDKVVVETLFTDRQLTLHDLQMFVLIQVQTTVCITGTATVQQPIVLYCTLHF